MIIENSFEVPAPPEQAWALLQDVPRIVPCMPGAELVEIVNENAWKVAMHVRLGPIAMKFDADLIRDEVDEQGRVARLSAKAREARGRGGARARIESRLSASGGVTQVNVTTDLSLQGAVAQYGRGIAADVAAQLTQRFAECLAAQLQEAERAQGAPATTQTPTRVRPVGAIGLALDVVRRGACRVLRKLFGRQERD